MDKETKIEFGKLESQIEKLATMMAEGFSAVDERFNQEHLYNENQFTELRQEIKSIRSDLERIPDDIDKTYSSTINNLLERVIKLEKQLAEVS